MFKGSRPKGKSKAPESGKIGIDEGRSKEYFVTITTSRKD